MRSEHEAFDRALAARSDRLECRQEESADAAFLHALAARCSPLHSLLPAPMLEQQAAAQEASHRAQHPDAMRRIAAVAGVRAGRIVIDWGPVGVSHGVDIAVLPELRSSGVGLHLLRAWLDVADAGGWRCTLDVSRANPAIRLYAHLGFRVVDGQSGPEEHPFVRMARPPKRQASGSLWESHGCRNS